MSMQIFPMAEILERAELASPGVKSFDVYQGHVTSPGQHSVLVLKLLRNNGQFNPAQLAYTAKLRGNFTVVARPGNETFYISSDPLNFPMQGIEQGELFHLGGQYGTLSTNEYVNRLLELERENTALRQSNEALKKELEQFQDAGGKFSYALNNLLENFILPKFAGTPQAQPIQGTMSNLKNIPIQGTHDEQLEGAVAVIIAAFGEDWVIKFAKKLQDDPQKVDLIKQYLP